MSGDTFLRQPHAEDGQRRRQAEASSASTQLSFLEFNYMVCQAYDFVELYRRYGCRLQSCGSDQWGNVVSGIDLGRRLESDTALRPVDAADHHRLGRENGARRSRRRAYGSMPTCCRPYDYWQFWRNTRKTPTSCCRFLAALHRQQYAARRDRADSRSSAAPKSTKRKKILGQRGNRHAARPRGGPISLPTRRARRRSRKACWPTACPTIYGASPSGLGHPARQCGGGLREPRTARRQGEQVEAESAVKIERDSAVTDPRKLLVAGRKLQIPTAICRTCRAGRKRHVLLEA